MRASCVAATACRAKEGAGGKSSENRGKRKARRSRHVHGAPTPHEELSCLIPDMRRARGTNTKKKKKEKEEALCFAYAMRATINTMVRMLGYWFRTETL